MLINMLKFHPAPLARFAMLLAGVLACLAATSGARGQTAEGEITHASFERWHDYEQPVHVTESGLQYKVLDMGDGPRPTSRKSKVSVLYRGFLEDGTQFDTTYEWGVPLETSLRKVIDGWEEGVQLMPTGSRFAFLIPPELAYGKRGRGPIPPNATLLFEIELLEVKN